VTPRGLLAAFFTLLAKSWQPSDYTIYLNTETKSFSFPGLDIRCPRVGLAASRELGWGKRLRRCLETIPLQTVLYLQEDYFVKDTADVPLVDRVARLMADEHIAHINLMWRSPGQRSSYRFLSHMDQRAEYRVSAQAGLWKASVLRTLLRGHETVAEFEWYGGGRGGGGTPSYTSTTTTRRNTARRHPYDGTG
jgi:hypothetical protein